MDMTRPFANTTFSDLKRQMCGKSHGHTVECRRCNKMESCSVGREIVRRAYPSQAAIINKHTEEPKKVFEDAITQSIYDRAAQDADKAAKTAISDVSDDSVNKTQNKAKFKVQLSIAGEHGVYALEAGLLLFKGFDGKECKAEINTLRSKAQEMVDAIDYLLTNGIENSKQPEKPVEKPEKKTPKADYRSLRAGQKMRYYTEEDDALIIANGKDFKKSAEALGRSEHAIESRYSLMKKRGIV